MMLRFMKFASTVMILVGILKTLTGDASGPLLVAAGIIGDLQVNQAYMTNRILALEKLVKKEKTDATESTQGS